MKESDLEYLERALIELDPSNEQDVVIRFLLTNQPEDLNDAQRKVLSWSKRGLADNESDPDIHELDFDGAW